MRLDGKTAMVTGAAVGIGAAIARRLATAGARVVLSDVDAAAAQRLAAELEGAGGEAVALALDVTDEAAVERAVGEIDGRFGLDVMVNNAGTGQEAALWETETAVFRRLFEINVLGVFAGQRAAARVMRARGAGGRIVNLASIAGLRGSTGRTAYGATKAAVVNMTQVGAVELAPDGITVNAVAPGPIETPLTARIHSPATRAAWARHVPARRYGTPEEVAGVCVYLACDEAAYTTGQVIAIDGGFTGAGLIYDIAGHGWEQRE